MEIKDTDKIWLLDLAAAVVRKDEAAIEKMREEVQGDIIKELKEFYNAQNEESNT